MTRQVLFALLSVLTALSCAPALQTRGWAGPDALQIPDPLEYQGYGAVVLFERRDYRKEDLPTTNYTESFHHKAVAILTEDGFDEADPKIYYRKKAEILDFEARTIRPDGTSVFLKPENVFDDEAKDKDGFRVRTFSMPQVSVGSVVEYRYTIRSDIMFSYLSRYVVDDIPVLDYRVTISGPNSIRYAAQTFNSPANWRLETKGKNWKLTYEVKDMLPQDEAESFVGSRRRTMPWWLFVVRQVVSGSQTYGWSTDWSEAIDWRCKALTWGDKDWDAAFDPSLVDVSGCSSVDCKIDRALAWLRENVVFEAWWSWPGRSAREIVESGNGTGVEKARLLRRILEHHGIESHFALTARRHLGLFDPNFPAPTGFNSLVLHVPAQAGIKEPRWLDPVCEYCRQGEVGRYHLGQPAVVMKDKKSAVAAEGEVEAWVEAIAGKKPKLSGVAVVDRVQIRDSDLLIRTDRVHSNRYAMFKRDSVSDYDAEDFEEEASNCITFRSEVGQLKEHEAYAMRSVEPEEYVGVQTEVWEIPGHVVRDGEVLLVPLDFMKTGWDDDFILTNPRHPVTFAYSRRFTQVTDIEAPSGYRFEDLPEAFDAGESPLVVSIRYEPTEAGVRITQKVKTRHGIYPRSLRARFKETMRVLRDQRAISLRLIPDGHSAEGRAAMSRWRGRGHQLSRP